MRVPRALKLAAYAVTGAYIGLQIAKLNAPAPVIHYIEKPLDMRGLVVPTYTEPTIPETNPTAVEILSAPLWSTPDLRPEIHYITRYHRHGARKSHHRVGTLRHSQRLPATVSTHRASRRKPKDAIIIPRKVGAYAF